MAIYIIGHRKYYLYIRFRKVFTQNTFFVESCNMVSAFGTIIVSRLTFYVAISSPFLFYINEEK